MLKKIFALIFIVVFSAGCVACSTLSDDPITESGCSADFSSDTDIINAESETTSEITIVDADSDGTQETSNNETTKTSKTIEVETTDTEQSKTETEAETTIWSDGIPDTVTVEIDGVEKTLHLVYDESIIQNSGEFNLSHPLSPVILTSGKLELTPPSFVREGDKFLGWKVTKIYYNDGIYYADNDIYLPDNPEANILFEGELTLKAKVSYYNDLVNGSIILIATPDEEYLQFLPEYFFEYYSQLKNFSEYKGYAPFDLYNPNNPGYSFGDIAEYEISNYPNGLYECEITINDYDLVRSDRDERSSAVLVDMKVLSVIEYYDE